MTDFLRKESAKDRYRRYFHVIPSHDDQWIVTMMRGQNTVDCRVCHADHIQVTMDIMLEENL